MIAIPSGMQIFCWIATLWGGRLRFKTPLLFVLGFFFIFVIGGLTGVMLASVPLDLQVHDTFFVVAHFHYVLIGGAVFPLFGGLFYWFPKMTGRMLTEAWGKVSFWLVFVGFNLTFFPHAHPRARRDAAPGLHLPARDRVGEPEPAVDGRRVHPRARRAGLRAQRGSSACGAASRPATTPGARTPWSGRPPRRRRPTTSSYLPTVSGRSPRWLWHDEHPVVTGLRSDRREFLITEPARRRAGPPAGLPRPHALALHPRARRGRHLHRRHLHPLGAADRRGAVSRSRSSPGSGRGATRATSFSRRSRGESMKPRRPSTSRELPTTAFGQRDPLWWGVTGVMCIEGTMFALMAASYFYLRGGAHVWPPPGVLHPGLGITTLNLAHPARQHRPHAPRGAGGGARGPAEDPPLADRVDRAVRRLPRPPDLDHASPHLPLGQPRLRLAGLDDGGAPHGARRHRHRARTSCSSPC